MIKRIVNFTIAKEEIVDEQIISTNEAGEQVTTTKKVPKNKEYKFFLKKPNRIISDEASLYYGIQIAVGVKAGLLTIPMIEKRNSSDGGLLSENDEKRYIEVIDQLINSEREFQQLEIKKEEKTEEEKTKHKDLGGEIAKLRMELQKFEFLKSNIFENTAEFRARNMTIVWWLLNLSYQETDDGKIVPFFGDGKHDDKLNKYDEYSESGDKFINKVMTKFLTYVSLWASNRASTPEDFEKLEKMLNETDDKEINPAPSS